MKKHFWGTVVLAASMLAITACGSNSEKTTEAAKETTETTAAAQTEAVAENVKWDPDTVNIYVPTKAGNAADLYIRFITPELEAKTGKTFVIINQTDGNGKVAYETVRNAKGDGANLLYFLNSMIVQTHTGVYDKSVAEDFSPIAVDTSSGSMWMIVPADSKYDSVQDVIDDIKANPGTVKYGMTSGQALHLLGGAIQKDVGESVAMVDAGGNSERLLSLLGGNIDFTFVSTSAASQYLEDKQIKVLGAVTGSGERDPLYPDIASVTEEGLPSVKFGFDTMLLGPADMDPALVEAINGVFQDAMQSDTVVEQFKAMGNTMTPLDAAVSKSYVVESDKNIAELAKSLGF